MCFTDHALHSTDARPHSADLAGFTLHYDQVGSLRVPIGLAGGLHDRDLGGVRDYDAGKCIQSEDGS